MVTVLLSRVVRVFYIIAYPKMVTQPPTTQLTALYGISKPYSQPSLGLNELSAPMSCFWGGRRKVIVMFHLDLLVISSLLEIGSIKYHW